MSALYPFGLPIALSLTAYNAFLTGLIVLLKRRDSAGFRYFIASFTIFLWGTGISFMLNNDLPASIAMGWGTFSQIAALFIPATWLHFVAAYTEQQKFCRKKLWLAYIAAICIFPFSLGPQFVAGYRTIVGIKFYPIPGPAYAAFTVLFAAVIVYSFWIFYQGILKAATGEKRKDYALVGLASLYGFLTGSFSFLPVYGVPFPQYNLLLMPLWQILLAYSMIRYRIFDLEELAQAAQRSKLAAIGTLATSINHEIRNPLYVIQGLADSFLVNVEEGIYASKEAAFERAHEILNKTRNQATRAMDIMKRFAVFAKQGVNQEANIQPVDLNVLLEEVLPLVSHELELDKITFDKNIPQDFPALQADRRHLEEILFNLLVNACQAFKSFDKLRTEPQASSSKPQADEKTASSFKPQAANESDFPEAVSLKPAARDLRPEAKPRLEISAAQVNGHINILISDNGPGIPANRLKQIFEPFYTTKDEGTGLGLYITKQLVERNGGKISVKSKPGEGTSFRLEFERAKVS